MHLVLWVAGSLTGCSWLMENPDDVTRERAERSAGVRRSNQVEVDKPSDPTMRDSITTDVLKARAEKAGKKRYNPVVLPVETEGKPVEFQSSNGVKIIRPQPKSRLSGYDEAMRKATPEQMQDIREEQDTARRIGNR